MLERATRCLNTGGRQTTTCLKTASRTPATALQTRRHLHSTFWRHGAGDLDLPSWCFNMTQALFEPDHTTDRDSQKERVDMPNPSTHASSTRHMFLDFLYPEKTKAMIRRLSVYGYRTWRKHLKNMDHTSSYRSFGSTSLVQRQKASVFAKPSGPGEAIVSKAASTTMTPEEARQRLEKLIEISSKGEYRESWGEAWLCYQNLDDASRTTSFRTGLMQILSTSTRSRDWHRLLHVFKEIIPDERSSDVYLQAVIYYLKVKDTNQAVAVHQEAMLRLGPQARIGSELLLAHLISTHDWTLTAQVWTHKLQSFEDKELAREWQSSFENSVCTMPGLPSKVLDYMHEMQKRRSANAAGKLEETMPGSLFLSLVLSVLKKGGNFGTTHVLSVLEELQRQNAATSSMYETLCLRTLEDRSTPLATRMSPAHRIYREYRADAKAGRPSRSLLHALIKSAVQLKDLEYALVLLADWQRLYKAMPSSLTGIVIKGLAQSGDFDKAEQMLRQFAEQQQTQQGELPDLKLFYPLLQYHAERAAPDKVKAEFERIKSHNQVPDTVCWNILLHAYEKGDDLDGVLTTLSTMLDSSVLPDAYTVGTVLAAAANRGDIDLCEQMLAMAQNNGIARTPMMHDCMTLAFLNDSRPKSAETYARNATRTMSALNSTRMWNQILGYYSLNSRISPLDNILRLTAEMQATGIRFDATTYACILRAYVVSRKTDAARRILQKWMNKNVRPTALHYAILIDGYADQRMFERGIRVYTEMVSSGIASDRNSQIAMQRLHILAARAQIAGQFGSVLEGRSVVSEELLDEIAANMNASAASEKPALYSSQFSGVEAQTAALFGMPLTFYSDVRAFDAVSILLEKYEKLRGDKGEGSLPLKFIGHLMNLHYRERNFDEVEKYWELAKSKASRTYKIATRSDYIPSSRRTALSRHIDIYLRTLTARGETAGRARIMYDTVKSVLDLGFELDNRNWNLYVQLLATRGEHVRAFVLCEKNLMASFPRSWVPKEDRVRFFQATRQKSQGTEFLGPRHTFLRPGELCATYKTMVRFAFVVRKLRRQAPYDTAMQNELNEIERKAPRTMRAVLDMPMIEHPIATHVLGKGAEKGQRRHLGLST